MLLRSGFIYNEDSMIPEGIPPLKIDFDHASKMWRENKIYLGNVMFTYINETKTLKQVKQLKLNVTNIVDLIHQAKHMELT